MKSASWKKKIKAACQDAGTYQPYFDAVIDTLASILEKRDDVEDEYNKTGAKPVITYVNKGGQSNPTKNPLLVMWADFNKDALAYWRDLGLTPSGYKKINEKAAQQNSGGFAGLLKSVNG